MPSLFTSLAPQEALHNGEPCKIVNVCRVRVPLLTSMNGEMERTLDSRILRARLLCKVTGCFPILSKHEEV